jgi:uncharacterized membrane protein YkvI
MKDYVKNSFKIASIFLGVSIGAGFISGQEPLQYYVKNSGCLLTMILGLTGFAFFNYLILRKVAQGNINSFDDYVVDISKSKLVGKIFGILASILSFVVFFAMFSAAGSLFSETFGLAATLGHNLSYGLGVAALFALCFTVFIMDAKGVLAVNTFLMPVKIFGILLICGLAVFTKARSAPLEAGVMRNLAAPANLPLAMMSLITVASWVSFNNFANSTVFIPFKKLIDKKSAKLGSILSGIFVGIILLALWLALQFHFSEIAAFKIPMAYIVSTLGNPFCTALYLILLCSGMFTTAVSLGFGLISQFKIKNTKDRVIYSFLACAAAAPFAYIPFDTAVGVLFKAFGYVGFAWAFIMLYDYFGIRDRLMKKNPAKSGAKDVADE